MRLIRTFAAAYFPLMLGGCADFTGMPSLEISLPEIFRQRPAEVSSPLPATDAPAKLRKDWWEHTDDTILMGIIQTLEGQNLSLAQARFRLNAARQDTLTPTYLPSLTTGFEVQYDRLLHGKTVVGNSSGEASGGESGREAGSKKTTAYYDVKLDASWEVPLYGQLGDTADIAAANLAFAQADVDAVRASVISEAIRLYAEMRSKQQQAMKRQAIVISARAIAEYQAVKYKAGLITAPDLGDSRQTLLTAQSEMRRTDNEVVARMQRLANLIGAVQPDEAWVAPGDIPVFDVPVFDDTPLDVLRNRPDIRKAEASVLAAAGDLEISKSDMYPKLVLSGSLSLLDNLTGAPLSGRTVQLSGVPSLSLPLFDWGKRLSAARIKDERLSEKASAYRETVIGAMNEVEEFWSSYRLAQAGQETADEQARIAREASRYADLLFKKGLSDGIAAETEAIDAADAEIVELQARSELVAKLTALTKALGGASSPGANEIAHD